jgi:hypothetical protein
MSPRINKEKDLLVMEARLTLNKFSAASGTYKTLSILSVDDTPWTEITSNETVPYP